MKSPLAIAVALLWAAVARSAPTHEQVSSGLSLFKGCMNTVVFERNGRKLLIDPGELIEAPGGGPVDWVLATHHHRDQCSGVARLIEAGAKLVVPAAKEKLFSDADGFWKAQQHFWMAFRPSRFTLRVSVAVARTVKAGDAIEWEGLTFEMLETPGHIDGHLRLCAIAPKRALSSRHVLGIAINADGQNFSELAEAIVDLPTE